MSPTESEKAKYGSNAVILSREGERTVFCPAEADGKATMTAYGVFPGVELVYNDVHASRYALRTEGTAVLMEINHCREGRIECHYGDDFYFLAPGDMSVSRRTASRGPASFPTGHYHGITVTVDLKRAPDCFSCFLQDVTVRPAALMEKFCTETAYFSARSSARVEHVFSELYHVPAEIQKGYFKVKIMELLLFLSTLPVSRSQPHLTRSQVHLAKTVGEYLLNNTDGKTVISDLSKRFGASPSLINASFRGVYGMTPAAFLRAQKMHEAAELLKTTDRTVLDIAGQFGYDNGSKFAKAFRDVIGVSPNSYRAGIDRDSCAPEGSE